MGTYYPSNPNDWLRTQAELKDIDAAQAEKRKAEKREKFRFLFTAICSAVAALAAVAGVLIQIFAD